MQDDLVTRLRRLDCCALSDALDSLGLSGHVGGLAPLSTRRRIAGRAVTVELVAVADASAAPQGKVQHLGTQAIEQAAAGDVIVVKQAPGSQAGCWGGILSLGASVRGIAGVVADGLVRDIDEAVQYDFPVHARGVTAQTARGRVRQLCTNGVLHDFRGITVRPGDLVLADGSGVVFIGADDAERVLQAAERIAAKEARMALAVLAGTPIGSVMGADYEHLLN